LFSFSNAQGTIQINNLTSYTLNFQLYAELDNTCDFNLYGWNNTYPSGFEYMFDLPPTPGTVTYTSYLDTGLQTPTMNRFRKSDTGTLYTLSAVTTLYGNSGIIDTSYWSFLKFTLMDEGESVFYCTIGLPSDCNNYFVSCDDANFYAEIFALSGVTYFNIF
jgi:hypothetical protein